MRRRQFIVAAAAASAAVKAQGEGASFPSRPVRLIVGTTAGSATDLLARNLAQHLQAAWSQPVLVENALGGTGQLATLRAVRAPADGHVITITNTSLFTNAAWLPSLPFDTLADLQGVASLVGVPTYLAVRPSSGWKSLPDLLDASRRAPGAYTYGSVGVRSGQHVGTALLADLAGVRWLHVPYKGSQETTLELMAGRLDMAMLPRTFALSASAAGKAMIVAVSEPVPWPEARGLPVLTRDYAGYRYVPIFGAVVAAATPRTTVDRIHDGFAEAVTALDRSGKLASDGFTARLSSPDEFQATIRDQVQLWRTWGQRLQLD